MKTWKKNLMAVAILLTVCSGIYLNWVYNGGKDTQDLEYVQAYTLIGFTTAVRIHRTWSKPSMQTK